MRQGGGGRRLKIHPRWVDDRQGPRHPSPRDQSWSLAPLLSLPSLHFPALRPHNGADGRVHGGDLDRQTPRNARGAESDHQH